MTNDDKLELLTKVVTDYWFALHRVWNDDDDWSPEAVDKLLESIDRCQRIRENIARARVVIEYVS